MAQDTPEVAEAMPAFPDGVSMFFLACLELTFIDGKEETGITRVNTLMKSDNGLINARLLGRAQQQAQIQLINSLKDSSLTFLNAVFLSISPLGPQRDEDFEFTQEDANREAAPEDVLGKRPADVFGKQ